jgi:beta-phosphoglucomutase-like phosphatase (HAD superfamily)
MNHDKVILTDADGCLFNWNCTFNQFMQERGYKIVPGEEENYSVRERFGLSSGVKMNFIKEFNHSDRIRSLPPHADAKEYVAKLNSEGYKFIVVTSLSEKPSAHEYRTHNLREHFGDAIIGLHCLRIGVHKADKLAQWKDTNMFWIEDHVSNAVAGAQLGLRSIVIDHVYNKKYDVDDHMLYARTSEETPWADIYEIIKGAEE